VEAGVMVECMAKLCNSCLTNGRWKTRKKKKIVSLKVTNEEVHNGSKLRILVDKMIVMKAICVIMTSKQLSEQGRTIRHHYKAVEEAELIVPRDLVVLNCSRITR
jgi:hypothetical protein